MPAIGFVGRASARQGFGARRTRLICLRVAGMARSYIANESCP